MYFVWLYFGQSFYQPAGDKETCISVLLVERFLMQLKTIKYLVKCIFKYYYLEVIKLRYFRDQYTDKILEYIIDHINIFY